MHMVVARTGTALTGQQPLIWICCEMASDSRAAGARSAAGRRATLLGVAGVGSCAHTQCSVDV